jgi:hypothetical protein
VGRTIIAINGPSGAGKSSLGHLIEARLRDRVSGTRPVFWFDAWMHDEANNLTSAFISHLLLALDDHRAPLVRWLRPLPIRLIPPGERIKKWLPLLLSAALIFGTVLGILEVSFPDLIKEYILQMAGGASIVAVSAKFVFTSADSVAAFVRNGPAGAMAAPRRAPHGGPQPPPSHRAGPQRRSGDRGAGGPRRGGGAESQRACAPDRRARSERTPLLPGPVRTPVP